MKLPAVPLLAALALPLVPTPADAASPVLLAKTQYDSPGSDDRSTASLNAEYVTVRNTTTRAVALTGWTLRDAANHVYRFPSFTLGAGKSVIVHTGRGTNSASHLYWGSGAYIWNNDGDTAYLRHSAGSTLDTCAWRGGSPGYTAC